MWKDTDVRTEPRALDLAILSTLAPRSDWVAPLLAPACRRSTLIPRNTVFHDEATRPTSPQAQTDSRQGGGKDAVVRLSFKRSALVAHATLVPGIFRPDLHWSHR